MESTTRLELRRRGKPLCCKQIWDAIKKVRQEGQAPTFEEIRKNCGKMTKIQVSNQISFLVLDGLLLRKKNLYAIPAVSCSIFFIKVFFLSGAIIIFFAADTSGF